MWIAYIVRWISDSVYLCLYRKGAHESTSEEFKKVLFFYIMWYRMENWLRFQSLSRQISPFVNRFMKETVDQKIFQ